MRITNASTLRKKLFSTLENVIEYSEPLIVTTRLGNTVILFESDYNTLRETIYLSSQPNLVNSIKEGEKESEETMATYNPNEAW